MKYIHIPFIALLVTLSFLSCSDNIVSECEVCTDDPQAKKITYTDIQDTIFNANCVSCHSGDQPAGGLNLSEGLSYNNLVNKQSNGSSLKRVEPFNNSASYLVKVMEGDNAPLMPPGAQLSQAKVDSVKSWIDRGADDDG